VSGLALPRNLRITKNLRLGPLLGGNIAFIALSAATIADTASIGATIGTLSVTGGSGSYTFTLTSNPGGLFSITSPSLKVAAALTAGSDAITVHADNGAGGLVNRSFLITVTHVGTYVPSLNFSDGRNSQYLAIGII
jgi:hypothetical protein